MTDITDRTAGIGEAWERGVAGPLSEFLTVFARGIAARPDVYSDDLVNSAQAVLATVEAPATTLAEDLRHIAEHWEEWATDTITSAIRAAADRAEQEEQERDEASSGVKRLTSERTSKESLQVDQTNPSDVKPGEAWLVSCAGGEPCLGFRGGDGQGLPWVMSHDDMVTRTSDNHITLVTRLVPAPRVVTNPDDLDRLAVGTIICTCEDLAMQKKGGDAARWYYADSGRGWDVVQMLDDLPATVLWEPEA